MARTISHSDEITYDALLNLVRTNAGIGFVNNDQGHPAYQVVQMELKTIPSLVTTLTIAHSTK